MGSLGLDRHRDRLGGEQIRTEQPGDGAGIVDRGALRAEAGRLARRHGVQEGREAPGRRPAAGGQALGVAGGGERLVGDVEAVDGERAPAAEDDRRRVRIRVDVELRGRGHVAARPRGAAHHDDLAHLRHQVGVFADEEGEIGERADRDEGDLLVAARAQGVRDEADRPPGADRTGRQLHLDPFDPALAVVPHRGHRLAHERPVGPRVDRHVRAPAQRAEEAGVAPGDLQGHVAGDGGDPGELDLLGGGERHRDGERVVAAGVAVEEDAAAVRARAGVRARARVHADSSQARIESPLPRAERRRRPPGPARRTPARLRPRAGAGSTPTGRGPILRRAG